jgi:hypothetical protein
MATFTWNAFIGAGPAWADIAANTVVFSSSLTDLATAITVGQFNDGTHLGDGDPGTDQCGANHANNVKRISNTEFSLNGGGTETLNDTNLTADENTLQVLFTDAASVATSSGRFYSYDGAVTTVEAVGIEAYAFEQGVAATAWTQINSDSGNIGGDNAGERLALSDDGAATEHTFYVSVSASPETVGSKTQFDFGIALVYS